jgi:hypothetical protein
MTRRGYDGRRREKGENRMVEVIDVEGWSTLSEAFVVDVRSLDDLKRVAEWLGIPLIFRRRREYLLVCRDSSNHFYRFKEEMLSDEKGSCETFTNNVK